jgi:hypothetical protein
MKTYLLLAAVVLAGVIPFSSRAVFMDEHIFLQLAQSAQTHWLFPQETPGIFFGTPFANFAAHTHPPVGEYCLALIYALIGQFHEVPFRILFSIFAIVAVLAFYRLAERFTEQPLHVTVLFALTPAFFVYTPTLMMDIPMLAFLLGGFALYFEHVQGRRGALAASSVCFLLSVGTGYTALVPLACFFICLLAARRPWKELLSVAAAPAALAIWQLALTVHFGSFPLSQTLKFYASQGSTPQNALAGTSFGGIRATLLAHIGSIRHNALATLTFLGGVVVFPWAAIGKRISPILMLLTIAAIYGPWEAHAYFIWAAVLVFSGIALLALFAAAAKRIVASGVNNGEALLLLWVPATLLFFIVVADMINARYILLAVPALYLVIFRDTSRSRLISILIPTAILSVTLAYADFSFVNANRDWVENAVPPLQNQGFRLWGAAESGLRFYLERQGLVSLTVDSTSPAPTDLIVRHAGVPGLPFRYSLSNRLEPLLTVIKTFTFNGPFPIRTFNAASHAGFHDSRLGLTPFAFSRAPFDIIEIAEVCALPGAVYSPKGPILKQTEAEREFQMKIPSNSKIEYEVQGGDGIVAVTDHGFRLMKGSSPVIVWRNFDFVPKQFAVQ